MRVIGDKNQQICYICPQVYLEPCQTSKMKHFAKAVTMFTEIIVIKRSGSEYASVVFPVVF